jgi:hypothetical protein
MSGSGWGIAGMGCLGGFGRGREWVDGDRRAGGLEEFLCGTGSFSASATSGRGSNWTWTARSASSLSLACSSSASITSTIEVEPSRSVDTDIISLPFTESDSLDPSFRSFVTISREILITRKIARKLTHTHRGHRQPSPTYPRLRSSEFQKSCPGLFVLVVADRTLPRSP